MDLEKQIYDSVRDENDERVYEMWHASSVADCPRAHYFKRLGVKPTAEVGAGKMLRWRVGHLVEEEIRTHLEKILPDVESNKRFVSEELNLTGEVDNIVGTRVIEIKSTHPFAMKYLEKDDEPYLAHKYQQHAYALLTDIDHITYVYVSLDGRVMVFEREVDQDTIKAVKKRLDLLNEAWEKQKPPVCLCVKDGKQNTEHPLWGGKMKWCDYKTTGSCCDLNLLKQLDEELDSGESS